MTLGTDSVSSAMAAHTWAQELSARNVANVTTPGFKRNLAVFSSDEAAATGGTQSGAGATGEAQVRFDRVGYDFSQGPLVADQNELSVAVKGDGFFNIQGKNSTLFTRNGSFRLNENGVIVTQDGDPVLGADGEIQVPPQTKSLRIDAQGRVLADNNQVGQFKLTAFTDLTKLRLAGGCQFADEGAGPRDPTDSTVHQGFLESSNVDPTLEMVRMIATSHDFDACARSLQSIENSAQQLYAWART